jgi:precorrin-3B synthase
MIAAIMQRAFPSAEPAPLSAVRSLADFYVDFCPGILHAVPAKDGLLMRLRLPGGGLPAATLAAIADLSERYGDGAIDLTARANIQLRGIRPESLAPMIEGLRNLGLLPSPAHERVRNILVSPFAGVDPTEMLDLRGMAHDLDRALIARAALASLPPKFAFTLDGGGRDFDPGGTDLKLTAVMTGAGPWLHLSLAGRATGLGASPADACALLIQATHSLRDAATDHNLPARGRAIIKNAVAFADFTARLTAGTCIEPVAREPSPEFGILSENSDAHATLLPIVPLGRLTAQQARSLSRFDFDMRLTPWRNLAFCRVARSDIPMLTGKLAALGLSLDGHDGHAGLAACAGSDGCAAALGDVRSDAARFAASLANTAPAEGWTIHFAGCAKRCAMRGGATVDLIASQNGYDVLFDGTIAHTGLSPERALAAARTAYPTKAP